ncbi:MAG: Gfo/Idh/MocA family oxidoreductase [Alphaproteobacteria bacterium]|nr:Gfo/Idh/MocA family oxidoreductase [Alphaproteobacteria bacterium]
MSDSPQKLAVAVLGLGWVATTRHIPALLRNESCRLVGVIDRDPAKAAAVAAKFNLPHHTGGDLQNVGWLKDVDAVSVGAPPQRHHDLVCAALGLGKHVLTEKPFAMTVAEGAAMQSAAESAGRILAVVHNFQFARAMRKLLSDINNGRLGKINWIAAHQLGNPRRRLPVWYPELPLGLFYDESPHFYYLLRCLAGDLTLQDAVARGRTADNNTPDEIRLLYHGRNNLPVSIDCNFKSPLSEWGIMVGGDRALGVVDIFRDFYLRLPQDGSHSLLQIVGTSLSATLQHWIQYVPNGISFLRGRLDYGNDTVMARFAEACRTGKVPEGISASDAQAVLRQQHDAIAGVRWL